MCDSKRLNNALCRGLYPVYELQMQEKNLDFINKVPDLRAVKGLHNLWNP